MGGGRAGRGGGRRKDAAKDMAFLPPCVHADAQTCEGEGGGLLLMLSLFSLLLPRGHNHIAHCLKKKKLVQKGWGGGGWWSVLAMLLHCVRVCVCVFEFRRPRGRAKGKRRQGLLFPAPKNLQRSPIKRESVQLDSTVDSSNMAIPTQALRVL